jgi:hypothetical protein
MKGQTMSKLATWADYLAVNESRGGSAAWAFAQANFAKSSEDYKAAQRFHAPSAAQKRESRARIAAVAAVTAAEARVHCQV